MPPKKEIFKLCQYKIKFDTMVFALPIIGSVIGFFVNVIIIFLVIVLADEVIAHNFEIKKTFLMSVIAYLLIPVALIFLPFYIPFGFYLIPLIVWVLLSELLLVGERSKKAIVGIIAFVVYILLYNQFINIPEIISSFIGF